MVFVRRNRQSPSAWWLVPVGLFLVAIGFIIPAWGSGYTATKGELICFAAGAICVVVGVVGGIRGERIEK